jgi:hypothetical protein
LTVIKTRERSPEPSHSGDFFPPIGIGLFLIIEVGAAGEVLGVPPPIPKRRPKQSRVKQKRTPPAEARRGGKRAMNGTSRAGFIDRSALLSYLANPKSSSLAFKESNCFRWPSRVLF